MSRPTHTEIMQFCHLLMGGEHGMMPLSDMGYNRGIEDAIESLELLIGFLRIIQSDRTEWPDLSPEGKATRAKWSDK